MGLNLHSNFKLQYVVLEKSCNIYNMNEVMTQTLEHVLFPLEGWG